MWTWLFWKQALERAVKTFAQAAIALLTGDKVFGILDADWTMVGQVAALALVLSILSSLVSAPIGPDKESPSLVDTPPPGPDPVS